MIKLIASDMDGTLIGSNRKISKENIEAIKMAQRKGIKFVIATGRAYEDVRPLLDEYDLKCECIILNGGEYKDIAGKTIVGIYIKKNKVTKILEIMSQYNLAVEIYTDKGYYTTNTKEDMIDVMMRRARIMHPDITDSDQLYKYAINHPHLINMKYINNLNEFIESDVNIGKLISFADSVHEIDELKEKVNKLDELAISSSFVTNIEINDVNATKGNILVKASEKMDIKKDEVAVLGDGSNDYSMFIEFPNSFAMKNAIPEIKEVAKYITESNSNNGVAKAICKILDVKNN